jgi:RHS repeat-associated protein
MESSGRTVNWTYDNIDRLTNEAVSLDPHSKNGSVAYGMDPVGNRQSQTSTLPGIATVNFTYDANDRILSTETYDSNGNTLTSGGKTFNYDFANRLKSVTAAAGTVTMVYDGDGNRVAKTMSGVTTPYLVDDRNPTGYPQVVEELVGGSVQRTYTYGKSRIAQNQLISGIWTPSFYGYDGLGSVRLLTDATGVVTDTYDYDAWGNVVNTTGTTPNLYLYRGEQYDPDLGLYYLRARYVNPLTGRFLTRDPAQGTVQIPQTLHKYLYVAANPVRFIDPTGQGAVIENTEQNVKVSLSGHAITHLVGRGISVEQAWPIIEAAAREILASEIPNVGTWIWSYFDLLGEGWVIRVLLVTDTWLAVGTVYPIK